MVTGLARGLCAVLLAGALACPAVAQTADPAPSLSPMMVPNLGSGPVTEPAPYVGAPQSTGPLALPSLPDYSLRGMVMAAHWVVKSVMALLAAGVFATLTVLLYKSVELTLALARAARSLRVLAASATLADAAAVLSGRRCPVAGMAQAAVEEMRASGGLAPAGVKERVRSVVDRIDARAGQRLRRGTGLLATIGSTAPFVGLFGTVWGIMTSFVSIAETKTTNLAVVAPGIAEALLATAIGLVAAIPAVVIYNALIRRIAAFRHDMADAGAAVDRLVSRDLDRQLVAGE